jgi:hypothetical protein
MSVVLPHLGHNSVYSSFSLIILNKINIESDGCILEVVNRHREVIMNKDNSESKTCQ